MKEPKKKNRIIVILVLLIIAVAVILGLTIYNTPSRRLSRQLDLGEKYLEDQNYEQAVVEFDKAISIDPLDERAYIGKAAAYIGMGDYEQAADTYATALHTISNAGNIWSITGQFYSEYAQSYIDDGDFERAITVLEEGYDLLGSEKIYNMIGELVEEAEQQVEEEQRASGMVELPFNLKNITVNGYDLLEDHFAEMRGMYPTNEGYEVTNTTDLIIQEYAADGYGSYFINNTTYEDGRKSQSLIVWDGYWSYEIFYPSDGAYGTTARLMLSTYGNQESDFAGLSVPVKPGSSYEEWCEVIQIAQIKENGSQPERDGYMVNIPVEGEYPSESFSVGEEDEYWVFITDEYRGIYLERRSDYGVWCELSFRPPMAYSGERRARGYRIRANIGTDGIISQVEYECDLWDNP